MYGTDAPQGFVPVFNESTGMTANAELSFPIANGYAQNIFTGDLVILQYSGGAPFNNPTGYMSSLFDYASTLEPVGEVGTLPLLGVFSGCSYVSPTDTTFAYQPRRTYWPASTQAVGPANPIGYFIPVSAQYSFTVQCGATPPAADMAGKFVKAVFAHANNLVLGDTQTGQSKMSVSISTIGTYRPGELDSIQILGLDQSLNAGQSGNPTQAVPYGNVLVRLCNSALPLVTNYPA